MTSAPFIYEETDIEPGLTLVEWRRLRSTPSRPSPWSRLRLRRAASSR